jgi:hypothetical protein
VFAEMIVMQVAEDWLERHQDRDDDANAHVCVVEELHSIISKEPRVRLV